MSADVISDTNNEDGRARLGFVEFVTLMAMMTSLAALSTDAMLPALSIIGMELGVQGDNDAQLIVSLLFFGMAAGQMFYGPISDSSGRKPAVYAGYAVYIVGCVLSIVAVSFPIMLIGRLLQGFGIAGPRSVTMALIRDLYEGRSMARIMSFIATVFILVPIIAPAMGQAILLVAAWRAIFVALLVLALISLLWFALRQPETLPATRRVPFSLRRIGSAIVEVLRNRSALGFTIAAGLASGGFMGYLSSSQQIFQDTYGVGTQFALYFAMLASALGIASFVNGRLVLRYGMQSLSTLALWGLCILSVGFFAFAWAEDGQPFFWAFMGYMMLAFFCIGILFGNMNSLAMEPLGHIAGVGAAVVASLSLAIAALLGAWIGQSYNGTVLPLVGGFALLSLLALAVVYWAIGGRAEEPAEASV